MLDYNTVRSTMIQFPGSPCKFCPRQKTQFFHSLPSGISPSLVFGKDLLL